MQDRVELAWPTPGRGRTASRPRPGPAWLRPTARATRSRAGTPTAGWPGRRRRARSGGDRAWRPASGTWRCRRSRRPRGRGGHRASRSSAAMASGLAAEDGVVGVLAEGLVGPVAAGHADHRAPSGAVPLHVVERREQLALREVAGGAEQHQDIGFRLHADHRRRGAARPLAVWARSGRRPAPGGTGAGSSQRRDGAAPDAVIGSAERRGGRSAAEALPSEASRSQPKRSRERRRVTEALPSEASRSQPKRSGGWRRRSSTRCRGGRGRPGRRRA